MPPNQFPILTASTPFLHICTVLYIVLLVACDPNILSIVFSSLYCVQMVVKYVFESKVYRSEYYGWGFILVDLLAGPATLALSLYQLSHNQPLIHFGCIFIVLKIITCKLYIVILKQIYYVASATWYYLRLSVGVFVCFCCISFFTFRPYSKFYCSLHETMFSMYQLSTFDAWDDEPVGEIRQFMSNAWIVYFFAYFLVMIVIYLATMLSFFTTYYTNPQVQLDFRFRDQQYVLVKDIAQILNLEAYPKRKGGFRESEMYLAGFSLWAVIESTDHYYIKWRVYMLILVIVISICVFYYQIMAEESPTMRFSTVLSGMKAFGGFLALIFCLIYKTSTTIVFWIYLFAVLVDLIRSNSVVLNLLKNHWLVISEYLIIVFALCYGFAVVISRNDGLMKIAAMLPKVQDLFNAFLLNVEIMGFDGWGKLAKDTVKEVNVMQFQRPEWIYYFVVTIFVVGFIMVNVFAGQVVELVSPEVEAELKLSQRQNTRLQYTDLDELVRNCRKAMKEQNGVEVD